MLEGKIEQLALYWMVDAERILNDSKYVEAYEIVKKVSLFSTQGKKSCVGLNLGWFCRKEKNFKI